MGSVVLRRGHVALHHASTAALVCHCGMVLLQLLLLALGLTFLGGALQSLWGRWRGSKIGCVCVCVCVCECECECEW